MVARTVTELPSLLEQAQSALAARDWPRAAELWGHVKHLAPKHARAWYSLGAALRQQGELDAAEMLLAEALIKFPDSVAAADEYAWVAAARREWQEALWRWERAAKSFPDHVKTYLGRALALQHLRRLDEADALLVEARAKFPNHQRVEKACAAVASARRDRLPSERRNDVVGNGKTDDLQAQVALGMARATEAVRRRDWPAALLQWQSLAEHAPRLEAACVGLGQALRGCKKLDEADAYLRDAIGRLPGSVSLAAEYANVATDRRDWGAARERWSEALRRFPQARVAWVGNAKAILTAGDAEAAESFSAEACKRFPDSLTLAINHARAANARLAWGEALQRWEALKARFPRDARVKDGLGAAKFGQSLQAAQTGGDASCRGSSGKSAAQSSANDSMTDVELVERFESLGQNCEFGLLQRRVGAEPIGLLRFSSIAPAKLIDALDADFAGVGSPDYTNLSGETGEYATRDSRYGMASHTFIRVGDQDEQVVFKTMCTKLQFLRRKLLEDLEDAEKIFLYKVAWTLSDDEELRLEQALHRHGPVKLMVIRLADGEHAPGTLVRRSESTIDAYIERHGNPGTGVWDIPVDGWLALCRRAVSAWGG